MRFDSAADDVRVGRSEECPPELLNRQAVERELALALSAGVRSQIAGLPVRQVVMDLRVDSMGGVIDIRPQTFTMIGELDSLAVHVSRKMTFRPATRDRLPTTVWIRIPLGFEVVSGTRR
jgi:hypothetical protein